jgi:hypothetical protein
MKRIGVLVSFVAILAVACQKERSESLPQTPRIENNLSFMEFKNIRPVGAFNRDSVPIVSYYSDDSVQVRAYRALSTIKLKPESVKSVFLKAAPGLMSPLQAEQYFSSIGYNMASLAMVGGLLNQRAVDLIGISFLATDVPLNIDFNYGNGAEPTVLHLQGHVPSVYGWFSQKFNNSFTALYALCKK